MPSHRHFVGHPVRRLLLRPLDELAYTALFVVIVEIVRVATSPRGKVVSETVVVFSPGVVEPDAGIEWDGTVECAVDLVEGLAGDAETGRASWVEVLEDLKLEVAVKGEEGAWDCGGKLAAGLFV